MKIKSITDVITNSSDETYIVKAGLSAIEVSEAFDKYMMENHRDEWATDENTWDPSGHTYVPDSYTDTPEGVVVSWDVMCNLNDAEEYLKECFGEDAIESYYNR